MPSDKKSTPDAAPVFNMDVYEKEKVYSTFVFTFDDRDLAMKDPNDIGWKELAELAEVPMRVIRYAMSDEDWEFFVKHDDVPGWKIRGLVRSYFLHYGRGDLGKAAEAGSLY